MWPSMVSRQGTVHILIKQINSGRGDNHGLNQAHTVAIALDLRSSPILPGEGWKKLEVKGQILLKPAGVVPGPRPELIC
jgi:hypothetical protein